MEKYYLVQARYPDGEVVAMMKPEAQIVQDFGFRDCTDTEYRVFDVSEFGKTVELEHIPASRAPFNYHTFVNSETGEVIFEGYSPER